MQEDFTIHKRARGVLREMHMRKKPGTESGIPRYVSRIYALLPSKTTTNYVKSLNV
jgi:hypothetical protein